MTPGWPRAIVFAGFVLVVAGAAIGGRRGSWICLAGSLIQMGGIYL